MKYFIFTVLTFLMTGGAQCEVTEVFAEEGSEAVLPCKSSSLSFNSIAIMWSKANKGTVWRKEKSGLQYLGASWSQSRIQCPHSQFVKGDYSLQINEVKMEDGGVYSCSMKLGNRVIEKVVNLRVLKVTLFPVVPIWGSDVSITCNVKPWPHGSSVQLLLNNIPFEPQTAFTPGTDAAYSVRQKAINKMAGNWTCVVRYKGKEGRSSAALSVKGIVQPFDDNTKVYAAAGSAAVLPCVFSANSNPSLPFWEKVEPDPLFSSALGHLPPSFSTSSLLSKLPWDRSAVLKEVAFNDEGTYRCSGTVQGHTQSRTMQLVVAKIDSEISSKKKGSVKLTCQLSDTSEVTKYEWAHVTYDLNGTQSAERIQEGKTLSISKVSAEAQGEWVCRFFGKGGMLGNVTHHISLMSGLSGQESTGSSHHTAAVVGLSFLLLVLLLILAQMYKNHQRRKRIHQYPALETIVHTISNEREEREKSRVKK